MVWCSRSPHDAAAAIFEHGLSGHVEEFIKTIAAFSAAAAATNSVFVMGKVTPRSEEESLPPLVAAGL